MPRNISLNSVHFNCFFFFFFCFKAKIMIKCKWKVNSLHSGSLSFFKFCGFWNSARWLDREGAIFVSWKVFFLNIIEHPGSRRFHSWNRTNVVDRDQEPKRFLVLQLQLRSCLITYGSSSSSRYAVFYFPVWNFNLQ